MLGVRQSDSLLKLGDEVGVVMLVDKVRVGLADVSDKGVLDLG